MASSRTGGAKYLRNRARLMAKAQRDGLTHCPGYVDTRGVHQPCGRELNYNEPRLDGSAEADHITPHAFGGTDDLDNLAVLCRYCNVRKGDGTRTVTPIRDLDQFPTTRAW